MGWPSQNEPWSSSPRLIIPFGDPQLVSTKTPLLALTAYARDYEQLIFTLRCHDVTNGARLYVDASQSGLVAESPSRQSDAPALGEATDVIDPVLRMYWGIGAAGDPTNGFPSVLVSFQLLGTPRRALFGR